MGVVCLLFLISIFFIWLTNLKWEVPVETNTLYSQGKPLTKSRSTLGFKLSFSFMPLIYLSSALSGIYTLYIMKGQTNWTDFGNVSESYKNAQGVKAERSKDLTSTPNSFAGLFILNENKSIFH